MREIPKKVDPAQKEHRKSLAWTYSALIFAFLCMGLLNVYAYFTIQKMSRISSTLTNSALNIKLEITSSDLLFREIVSGVSTKDMNDVWKIINTASEHARILNKIDADSAIRGHINDFKQAMIKYYKKRNITEGAALRFSNYKKRYVALMTRLDRVENQLKQLTASKMETFKKLYIALFINIIVLFCFLVFSFYRYSMQRKTAEKNLLFAKNSLNTVLNSIDSILVSVDSNKQVTQWNEAARKYTKISPEDACGQDVIELLPLLQNYKTTIEKVYRSHSPVELYRERVMLDKQMVYDISMNYTYGLDNVVIKIDDMTAHEQKDEQLRQSQKMSVVSNLIGGLAHSFNNALGAIIGTISMMKFSMKDENAPLEDIHSNMNVIESSAEKAEVMVQQLLSLSSEDKPEMCPVDLNYTLRHLMKICENTIDKSIELNAELYSIKALVMADPAQIEQVLLGLCDNAAHAMINLPPDRANEEMSLSVSLDRFCPDDKYRKKQPLATKPAYWAISVCDTGIGMSPEIVTKMFDPFFTTKEHATGLGLAVISDIVDQHNGYIEVRSNIGTGSIITVYLPEHIGEEGEESDEVKPDYSEQIPLGEGLVMVVDDEEVMRKTASNILQKLGYDIVTANDGEEAVAIFKEKHTQIVLTLLDLSMPKLSGKETYAEMKKINPDLKVLIVSGLANEERIKEVIDMGASGFIKKPYSMIDLARNVKKTISG